MSIVPLLILVGFVVLTLILIRFGMGRSFGLFGAAAVTKILWLLGFGSMIRGVIVLVLFLVVIGFATGNLTR